MTFCACANSYISCTWTFAGAFAYFCVYSCYFKTLIFDPWKWTFGTLSSRENTENKLRVYVLLWESARECARPLFQCCCSKRPRWHRGVDYKALQTIRRAWYGHRIGTRRGFHIERWSQGKRRRIQFKLLKRLPNWRYGDFIHNYRTLTVRVLYGADRYNFFSVTMVGRRVNSFRCWSIGKSEFLLPERGWRFAGLQIPSMAYPPSSTVSYFNHIFFISNLNDWLIVDGVFFFIRCIIL